MTVVTVTPYIRRMDTTAAPQRIVGTSPRTLTDAELAEVAKVIARWVRVDMKRDRAEHIARATLKRLAAA